MSDRKLSILIDAIEGLVAETPDGPVIASIDKGLMRQALTNLVKNAGEALRDVDRPPRVTLRVEAIDDGVRIVVEDNGPGIAADARGRVFEPYVTYKDDGTGLGLAIVRKIVLDHDGEFRHGPLKLMKRPIREMRRQDLPEHVPTLRELYDTVGTDFELSLDVKDPGAALEVIRVARAAGAETRLWLCHPDWRTVAARLTCSGSTARALAVGTSQPGV